VIVSKVVPTLSHAILNKFQYIMRAAALNEPHHTPEERNVTLKRVLERVVERKISHSDVVLYAREPTFVSNTYLGREGSEIVESSTWTLSVRHLATKATK
jgi:hypothetical protein